MTLQNYQKKDAAIRAAFERLKEEHPEQLKNRLKFSWSNWGFGLERFETSCERLERAGIRYIELHGNHYGADLGYKAKEINKILAEHGIACGGVCGMFSADNDLASNRHIQRQAAIDYIRREAAFTAEVGGIYMLVCPAAVGRAGKYDDSETDRSLDSLSRVADVFVQHGVLAAILAGLILAGILAATMSTADSQMLAAASSVSQNILQEFAHLKLSEKQSLFAARLTIVCVSVVGVVLARDPNSSVFGIVSFAWAGFGGAFGAVVLCALFWKRCNWQGALAGMLSGGLMVFVWKYLISPLGGVFSIYELLPAFLTSLLVCVVVSLVTPAPSKEIEAEFEAAK